MKENPEYELKLVDRTLKTNDDQIINEIQENLLITYKYYEIAFNNEKINSVNTIEEAEEEDEIVENSAVIDLEYYRKIHSK